MPRFISRKEFWIYFIVGALSGLAYVWIDVGVFDESSVSHGALSAAHEIFDTIFPVLSGVSLALGIFFLKQITRLNRRLSLKNDQLQKELLFNTIISQMFHEIQGPIHNISAAFEDSEKELNAEKTAIIRRNLSRLAELKKQYSEKNSGLDNINPGEPVPFKKWIRGFVDDKARNHIEASRIKYEESVEPLVLNIHPVLLEQVMQSIFSNAFEALESVPADKRELLLKAGMNSEQPARAQITLKNRHSFFPDDILDNQAKKPAASRHGLGLGLLLANRMLEQVGGTLAIGNSQEGAVVAITVPGKRA